MIAKDIFHHDKKSSMMNPSKIVTVDYVLKLFVYLNINQYIYLENIIRYKSANESLPGT